MARMVSLSSNLKNAEHQANKNGSRDIFVGTIVRVHLYRCAIVARQDNFHNTLQMGAYVDSVLGTICADTGTG